MQAKVRLSGAVLICFSVPTMGQPFYEYNDFEANSHLWMHTESGIPWGIQLDRVQASSCLVGSCFVTSLSDFGCFPLAAFQVVKSIPKKHLKPLNMELARCLFQWSHSARLANSACRWETCAQLGYSRPTFVSTAVPFWAGQWRLSSSSWEQRLKLERLRTSSRRFLHRLTLSTQTVRPCRWTLNTNICFSLESCPREGFLFRIKGLRLTGSRHRSRHEWAAVPSPLQDLAYCTELFSTTEPTRLGKLFKQSNIPLTQGRHFLREIRSLQERRSCRRALKVPSRKDTLQASLVSNSPSKQSDLLPVLWPLNDLSERAIRGHAPCEAKQCAALEYFHKWIVPIIHDSTYTDEKQRRPGCLLSIQPIHLALKSTARTSALPSKGGRVEKIANRIVDFFLFTVSGRSVEQIDRYVIQHVQALCLSHDGGLSTYPNGIGPLGYVELIRACISPLWCTSQSNLRLVCSKALGHMHALRIFPSSHPEPLLACSATLKERKKTLGPSEGFSMQGVETYGVDRIELIPMQVFFTPVLRVNLHQSNTVSNFFALCSVYTFNFKDRLPRSTVGPSLLSSVKCSSVNLLNAVPFFATSTANWPISSKKRLEEQPMGQSKGYLTVPSNPVYSGRATGCRDRAMLEECRERLRSQSIAPIPGLALPKRSVIRAGRRAQWTISKRIFRCIEYYQFVVSKWARAPFRPDLCKNSVAYQIARLNRQDNYHKAQLCVGHLHRYRQAFVQSMLLTASASALSWEYYTFWFHWTERCLIAWIQQLTRENWEYATRASYPRLCSLPTKPLSLLQPRVPPQLIFAQHKRRPVYGSPLNQFVYPF